MTRSGKHQRTLARIFELRVRGDIVWRADLHRQLLCQAQAKGTSVNNLVKTILGRQLAKQTHADVRPIRPLRRKPASRTVARS